MTSGEGHVRLGDPHLELYEIPYKAANSMVQGKVTITLDNMDGQDILFTSRMNSYIHHVKAYDNNSNR